MLPRWHILTGLAFTLLIWIFVPEISVFYLILIFLSSFLIDFDHYVVAFIRTKKIRLKHAFHYHKMAFLHELSDIQRNIKRKGDFHLFHTMEFHVLLGLLSLLWVGFFYVFIGMVFHSLLDIIDLVRRGRFHRREYFLFKWIFRRLDE